MWSWEELITKLRVKLWRWREGVDHPSLVLLLAHLNAEKQLTFVLRTTEKFLTSVSAITFWNRILSPGISWLVTDSSSFVQDARLCETVSFLGNSVSMEHRQMGVVYPRSGPIRCCSTQCHHGGKVPTGVRTDCKLTQALYYSLCIARWSVFGLNRQWSITSSYRKRTALNTCLQLKVLASIRNDIKSGYRFL